MRSKINIEEIPDQIKEEILDYAEYLMRKYKKVGHRKNWLTHIDRGKSKKEMASETIEKMRQEERW